VTTKDVIMIGLQLAVILIAGLGAYWGFVVRVERRIAAMDARCAQHVETLAKVAVLSQEMEKVKSENALFWKVIEPHIAKIIHSPVHKSRDELVDKFVTSRVTMEEALMLEQQLREALARDDWSNEKRLAAALLLTRVLMVTTGRER
jgi:hypothetical protein